MNGLSPVNGDDDSDTDIGTDTETETASGRTAALEYAFKRRDRVRRRCRRKALRMWKYTALLYAFLFMYRVLFGAPPRLIHRVIVTVAILCASVGVAYIAGSFVFRKLHIARTKLKHGRRTPW